MQLMACQKIIMNNHKLGQKISLQMHSKYPFSCVLILVNLGYREIKLRPNVVVHYAQTK